MLLPKKTKVKCQHFRENTFHLVFVDLQQGERPGHWAPQAKQTGSPWSDEKHPPHLFTAGTEVGNQQNTYELGTCGYFKFFKMKKCYFLHFH